MRIGILHYTTPMILGGVEAVIDQHARLFHQHGHQVVVLAGRTASEDRDDIAPPYYTERIVPLFDSLVSDVQALKAELDRGYCPPEFERVSAQIENELEVACADLDILIAHNVCSLAKNLPLTAALKRYGDRNGESLGEVKKARPQIIAWHHDFAWTSARYISELHAGYPWSLLIPNWDSVRHVVISAHRAEEFRSLVGAPEPKPMIIPNGIDLEEFFDVPESLRRSMETLDLLEALPLLLLPVRVTRRKNIELACAVASVLKATFPKIRLLVTGPIGPHNPENMEYLAELRELRANLQMEQEIVFAAERLDVPFSDREVRALYRLADALFLPSLEEGFGLPLIEAAAARLPIFCTDIPPLKELLAGEPGAFTPTDPPEKIAEYVRDEILNRSASRLFSRVKAEYDWNAVYHRYLGPLICRS